MNPKQLVADGYDRIAETYAARVAGGVNEHRFRHLAVLEAELPVGARVLDLGCGAGVPVARRLAERFDVTGVDISRRQIELARASVPNATFSHGDMTALTFPAASFDAVVAFFSLIHLPRDEHAAMFASIATWLRPGGLLVASTGSYSDPGTVEQDWLGAPMYWSFFASAVSLALIRAAGLEIVEAQDVTADEDGQPVTFLWVVARKPPSGVSS
ncbi:MAG: class I SAM-dependent methyltransferase [Chloroflexi bacterium]|nr:class I SAM-dependent methyltransferase [Chloroflexota bacterium]